MSAKPKAFLSKISKENRIKFGNNHIHERLVIKKSVLLLNRFGSSTDN